MVLPKELAQWSPVHSAGVNWLRYAVDDPNKTNPELVRYLTGQGVDVVTLSPVTQTLEEVYLQVVKEDEAVEHKHDNSD